VYWGLGVCSGELGLLWSIESGVRVTDQEFGVCQVLIHWYRPFILRHRGWHVVRLSHRHLHVYGSATRLI
jgi:hypothetical protein